MWVCCKAKIIATYIFSKIKNIEIKTAVYLNIQFSAELIFLYILWHYLCLTPKWLIDWLIVVDSDRLPSKELREY